MQIHTVRPMLIRILLVTSMAWLGMTGLGTATAQSQQPGQGVAVEPAVANWQSARPLAAIFVSLLEELGYDVANPVTLANAIFYASLVQGDVDYWAHSWMPNQRAQLPADFEARASFAGTVLERGALQGYMVDKRSAEEFGITSLADFARDEVREAFDTDGNGLAELVGCESGWACADTVQHHVETYGIAEHVEIQDASYSAMFANVLAKFRNDQPVLFYTWTPNYTVFELKPGDDVVWINVPEIVPTEEQEPLVEFMTVSGVEGAVSDPIRLGFPASDIRVAANDAFLEANPAAAALFGEVSVPLEDISSMTLRVRDGEDTQEEISAMALEWIEAHRDLVDAWLQTAREAAR